MENNIVEEVSFKLWDLSNSVEPAKFGYLVQALLAVCFYRLNATNLVIKNKGHPDITMLFQGKNWKIETEVISNKKQSHTLKREDIVAVLPESEFEVGAIVLLDMHAPVSWRVIMPRDIKKADVRYSMLALRRMSNREISNGLNIQMQKILHDYFTIVASGEYNGLIRILEQENSTILFREE